MKILHITDSHATMKAPASRRDVYYMSLLKKMYELTYVIRRENICLVLHTGDMFHTPRISDKLAGYMAELIRGWGVPVYVTPGNHDIDGYNIDTLEQSKLGLFQKAGVVKILDRADPMVFEMDNIKVAVSGQEYYANIDMGNPDDFKMQQPLTDINILCYHGFITPKPYHPDVNTTLCHDIKTDADIILSGHYHIEFTYENDDKEIYVYNPGSMMRVEQNSYNKNHMPQYGILDISMDSNNDLTWDYSMHPFKIAAPSTAIFDYSTKSSSYTKAKSLVAFKNNVQAFVNNQNVNTDIRTIVASMFDSSKPEEKRVCDKALLLIDQAKKNATNDVANNFQVSNSVKKIAKVEIKNFQSHKDTTIEFDNGMNIFAGESNNGKTSIIRAVTWCLTNKPSGNSFITTGESECSVKITFSDGTSIKRIKPSKGGGSYEIEFFQKNKKVTKSLSGFGNNLPVEILNISQMPAIESISGDEYLNIMTQFSSPFLLSESPANRAVIIGRLTGTDIIDNSIKENNKELLGLKKDLKTADAEIDKLNAMFNSSKIIDKAKGQSILNALSKMESWVNNTQKELDQIKSSLSAYQLCIKQQEDILKQQSLYKQFCVPNISDFTKKVMELKSIANKFNTYLIDQDNIKYYQDDIRKLKALPKINADKIRNSASKLSYIKSVFEDYCDTLATYYGMLNKHNKIRQIADIDIDTSQLNELCNKLEEINKLHTAYNETAVKIDSIKDSIKQLKAALSKAKKKKMEVLLAIVNSDVLYECPCCGQKVTSEETAEHIATYMKENSNGH